LTVTLRLPRSGEGLAAVGRRKSRAGDSFDVRGFQLLPGLFPSLDSPNK